jgi:hypothetical protein
MCCRCTGVVLIYVFLVPMLRVGTRGLDASRPRQGRKAAIPCVPTQSTQYYPYIRMFILASSRLYVQGRKEVMVEAELAGVGGRRSVAADGP